MLIVEHETGAQQARPAVAAARVGAVAELAVDAVERLAALDGRRVPGRSLGYAFRGDVIAPRPPALPAGRRLLRVQRTAERRERHSDADCSQIRPTRPQPCALRYGPEPVALSPYISYGLGQTTP